MSTHLRPPVVPLRAGYFLCTPLLPAKRSGKLSFGMMVHIPRSNASLSRCLFYSGLFSCGLYRWVEGGMSGFDYGLLVIMVLLLGVIWELDRIREHTDTLRQIASRDDEPPPN
jgi:hypothetical protein